MFVHPLSLDAIRQPAILYDADGRIAEANDLAEALAGRSLAGRTIAAMVGIFDVRSPDGTPLMASDLPATRALNGEEAVDVPLSVTAADGRTVHVLARASPLRDGGSVAGALVVWQDVSALAAQGEVLREIEAKYRSLFDSLDDGYCIIEMIFDAAGTPVDCRVLETNRAFENQTGLHDAIGKRMRELVPDHEEHWFEIYGTIARTGESQRFIQAAQPFMGGWYEVYAFPIRGRTSNRVAILFNDITELKRSEEALRLYAENLQRATEDLERFVRVSSHDLQEPLRLIVSFSQLLERRYRGKLDADADDYINFIVEGGTRMRALIYDLLAYSRVSATPQEYSSTDTADVLASVERSLAVQLREAGAVITHDPMPGVLADPLQLEQVFANLVSNAFKFRRLHEPLQVHVGARRTDGFWEFSVRDNGIGIEPEYYGRIFEMFRRLHTHDKFGGTGIGLAIVKRIIERHGGTIQVESTPGEGSTFFFTLPAA